MSNLQIELNNMSSLKKNSTKKYSLILHTQLLHLK